MFQLLEILTLIKEKLQAIYEINEAEAIAHLILEDFGFSRTDVILNKSVVIDEKKINQIIVRLQINEPIQYVLGYGWFYGRKFIVNNSTLIPRSETEELVELIVKNNSNTSLKILDIGTGSGCIPITLKLENPNFEVFGMDISEEAIKIAKQNSGVLEANVNFFQQDIFKMITVGGFDILVSNPPYVTYAEMEKMRGNVLDFEPHSALFVEDDNPLLFYKKIAHIALESETVKQLYFEINEQFGQETKELLLKSGFSVVNIVQDMQGKDRIVWGAK